MSGTIFRHEDMKIMVPDTVSSSQAAAGMLLLCQLQPTNVSFNNVKVQEVSGAAAAIQGFFKNSPLYQPNNVMLFHTARPPAQVGSTTDPATNITVVNVVQDVAELKIPLGTALADGTVTWNIPVQWQVSPAGQNWDPTQPIGQFPARVQTLQIWANGQAQGLKTGRRYRMGTKNP